jgi:hypothetical protein
MTGTQFKLMTRCEDLKDFTLTRLRALRLCYSVDQTAALLGASRWTVSAWLAGKKNPSRISSRFISLLVRLSPKEHELMLREVRPHYVDRTKRKRETGPGIKPPSRIANGFPPCPHDFEI